MYNKTDYVRAVEEFNSIKSFNIVLPKSNDMYKQLANKFTDQIRVAKDHLEKYEFLRKAGFADKMISNELCNFVVHINQITNGMKDINEPMASLEFEKSG